MATGCMGLAESMVLVAGGGWSPGRTTTGRRERREGEQGVRGIDMDDICWARTPGGG